MRGQTVGETKREKFILGRYLKIDAKIYNKKQILIIAALSEVNLRNIVFYFYSIFFDFIVFFCNQL